MNNSKNDLDAKEVLTELVIGIIILMLLECILGIFIADYYISYLLGTLLGGVTSVFFIINLYQTLNKSLDMDEKNAMKHSKTGTIIRFVVIGIVIVLAFTFNQYVSVVMTFIGIMSVKFSAYLQPLTHKCLVKIKRKVKV